MKSINEAIKEFETNEKFDIEIKSRNSDIRSMVDNIDMFLATKGIRPSSIDTKSGRIIFSKLDDVSKAKKVLSKSSYKNNFIARVQ